MNTETKKDPFYSDLRRLVVPIAIQSFMLALVSATDAAMLGMIDQNSMASVSQAGQIQFFLNLLIMGFSIGVGIMTAQYWGKGDIKTIERIAPTGLKIILAIGGSVTLAAFLIPGVLMRILTSDEALIPLGTGYLRTVALSYVLCGITQVYFSLLKNTGLASRSSAISSFAVVLNILLNGVLIFGLLGMPAMGIRGAALATVIARATELALAVLVTRREGRVQLRWRGLLERADKVLLGDFLHYTTPVIGASLVWGIAFMSYSIIMGHLGSDAVAANSITSIIRNLISCLIRGVGGGAGVMMGNLLGANRLEEAKRCGARLTRLAALVGLCTGGSLMLLSPVLVGMASLTDTAAEYLRVMLIFCGCNIMAQSINHTVLDGIFGAGGDARFDMITNIEFMWCFSVPFGFLAAFVLKWPVPVIYCIVNLDEILKLPAVFHHYRKYIWLRNITREME